MSGYTAGIDIGDTVFFDGEEKIVKAYFFTSNGGCHNSDIICIEFEDGTDNGDTGLSKISKFKMNDDPKWKDPKWMEELMDAEDKAFAGGVLDDGTVIPAGVGAISPKLLELINRGLDVGVSDFVKKRHLEELQFTHFDGSWDDLVIRTKEQMKLGNWSEGYRDGVRLIHMSKENSKDFYGYDGFKKFEGMKMEAVVEKVPGREHEPAKLQIKILENKIRMRYVDIILYRKDVLEEDGDPVTGADWEVISINGRLRKDPNPMNPLTMVRNYRHLPGGSSMPDKDPVEFLDELMDAVLHDKGMKHLIKRKK
jgi:hypothetical protein